MKHVASGDLVYHHALTEIPLCKQTSLDAELICHITFMGRLWVWGKGDVVELAKAKPLAIDRHAKVAEIDGLPGGLGDLVGGGSRGFALRRQIRHDDSADARQSQHHRGEKRRSSFCSRDRWKAPPGKSQSQWEEEIREDEKSIKTKRIKGQDGEGPQQVLERVLLFLLFMPASSSPPCYNWVNYAAVLKRLPWPLLLHLPLLFFNLSLSLLCRPGI